MNAMIAMRQSDLKIITFYLNGSMNFKSVIELLSARAFFYSSQLANVSPWSLFLYPSVLAIIDTYAIEYINSLTHTCISCYIDVSVH